MRLLSRRLTFQLTSLLDLLLIVIFAQFIEVRDITQAEQAQVEREQSAIERKLRQAEADLAELRDMLERDRGGEEQRMAELRQAAERLRAQLRTQQAVHSEELERALEQRDVVGRLMAELFKVPEELIEDDLKPLTKEDANLSPQDVARLRERFRQLSSSRDREIVEHILKYEELRKWCDIWEIHIAENGVATVSMGQVSEQIIVRDAERPVPGPGEFDRDVARTARAFEERLFEFYKRHRQQLPQAKSVVILFVTYGAQTPYLYRKPAIEAVRDAAERMRADAGGRPRFEYAILGMVRDDRTPKK